MGRVGNDEDNFIETIGTIKGDLLSKHLGSKAIKRRERLEECVPGWILDGFKSKDAIDISMIEKLPFLAKLVH